jgi:hypothetical protein
LKDVPTGEKHPALESLDLYRSNITAESLNDRVSWIRDYFPNIKLLDLSRKKIGDAGVALQKVGMSRLLDSMADHETPPLKSADHGSFQS